MLDWSTPGLISFSDNPDCVVTLFSECSIIGLSRGLRSKQIEDVRKLLVQGQSKSEVRINIDS